MIRINRDIKTPAYYYDLSLLERTLGDVKRAAGDFKVHYAVKANANRRILSAVASHGFGADCVSGGEVSAAVASGIPANKIVFAGVGKTDEEILESLAIGIGCFNVESIPELEAINELAKVTSRVATVAIRVNPNIDAHTHHYITTGLAENKFGINIEQLPEVIAMARTMTNIELVGLHFHIGSQILNLEPYIALCQKINAMDTAGMRIINVGGGLGINYEAPDSEPVPDFESYFACFRKNLRLQKGQELHFELGRSIVAQCGSLLTRVVYVKKGTNKTFIICDGGMNALIRPALYGARHVIENISARASVPQQAYDVVGPICESSDVFGTNVMLPETHRGDIIALRSAGAYGETMASNYNLRKLQKPIFSNK